MKPIHRYTHYAMHPVNNVRFLLSALPPKAHAFLHAGHDAGHVMHQVKTVTQPTQQGNVYRLGKKGAE